MLTNLDKFKTTTDHHSQVGALAAKTSALQSVLFILLIKFAPDWISLSE
jgi:hypothetical protein